MTGDATVAAKKTPKKQKQPPLHLNTKVSHQGESGLVQKMEGLEIKPGRDKSAILNVSRGRSGFLTSGNTGISGGQRSRLIFSAPIGGGS